ncbi:MAG TPA: hypothetical protein PKV56_18920 [Burkholderiaceae bacterium]|nr:hypothetical protein [Burkholderiaceae bacterium]
MTLGDPRPFDPEHLKKWWEVTCKYLMADSMSEPSAADLLGATSHRMIRGQGSQVDTRSRVRDTSSVDGARLHLSADGQIGRCTCNSPGRIGPPITANADRQVLTRK